MTLVGMFSGCRGRRMVESCLGGVLVEIALGHDVFVVYIFLFLWSVVVFFVRIAGMKDLLETQQKLWFRNRNPIVTWRVRWEFWCWNIQGGPQPLINWVIAVVSRVITPVNQIIKTFVGFVKSYDSIHNWQGPTLLLVCEAPMIRG